MPTAVARILDDLKDREGLRGADIANIVERLFDFYTPDETRLWLHASHPLLNHERAIDLIRDGRSEEVLAVIERLESGAHL